jgi:hypothetical protein
MASPILTWSTVSITFDYGFTVSIQKDFNRGDDGSVLTEKHIINVKGAFIAGNGDAAARFSALIQKSYSYAQKVATGDRVATLQMAPLTITTGGDPLTYDSVSLTNISTSEPPEDTAAIQYQEVTLTFETYVTPADPTSQYKLRSATENFEIRREDDKVNFNDYVDITGNTLYYGYTVTHTVSAQGLVNNKSASAASEAFNEAYKYVKSRKMDDLSTVTTDIFGRTLLNGNSLNAKGIKISGEDSLVASALASLYTTYNKVRTVTSDVATGSYSMTETYFQSKKDTTIEISASFNRDETGDSNVSVEGTIQGLSDASITADNYDKLTKAETVYTTLSGGDLKSGPIWALANDVFGKNSAVTNDAQLRNYPMQITVGRNKIAGSLNFNVMYKSYGTTVLSLINYFSSYKAITATATINDNNRLGASADEQTIVSIPVIGRGEYGPILQDMGVTKDRKRSVTVEVTVEPSQRSPTNDSLRNAVVTKAKSYGPTSGSNIKIESFSESWDWVAGKATANIGWIYQK